MRFLFSRLLTLVGLVALSLGSLPSYVCAQGFFTDRTVFDGAVANEATLTFDNLVGTPSYPNNGNGGYINHSTAGITVGGLNFVGYSYGYGYETYLMTPSYGGGNGIYTLNGTDSLLGGRGYTGITGFGGATAFGFDLGQSNTLGTVSGASLTVYLADSSVYTQALSFSPNTVQFVGFANLTSAIQSVTITANDPSGALPPYPSVIDNFTTATAKPISHQVFVTSDATINSAVPGKDIFVGKDSAFTTLIGAAITLTVADGASIDGYGTNAPDGNTYYGVNVFGSHQANIVGGTISSGVVGFDSSVISVGGDANVGYIAGNASSSLSITSGIVNNGAYITDTSALTVTGGYIAGGVNAYGSSVVDLSGGYADKVVGYNSSTINLMSGGATFYAFTQDASVLNINGGALTEADSYGASVINLNDNAALTNFLSGHSSSVINIAGGIVQDVYGYDSSVTNMYGGSLASFFGFDSSVFNLYGGIVGPNTINLLGSSALRLYGNGFALSSAQGVGNDGYGSYTDYLLTGFLNNGDALDTHLHYYSNGASLYFNDAAITVGGTAAAPEPGTLALLLPFAAGTLVWRKRTLRS